MNVYFSQLAVNGGRERHVNIKQAVITRNSITIKNSMVSKVGCKNAKRAAQGTQLWKAGRRQKNKTKNTRSTFFPQGSNYHKNGDE